MASEKRSGHVNCNAPFEGLTVLCCRNRNGLRSRSKETAVKEKWPGCSVDWLPPLDSDPEIAERQLQRHLERYRVAMEPMGRHFVYFG